MNDPLRSSETMERELLEFFPDAVIGVDSNGGIVLANSRTREVFGYERDELIGHPVELLVPERLSGMHEMHRTGYFENPRTRPMGAGIDLYARRKDGREFPCEVSLSAVATERGTIALAAIRDITERRQTQEGPRSAVRRLQAATDVALAIGGETELERVLGAIVERGRALVDARALVILLRKGSELAVAATAGGLDPAVMDLRVPADTTIEELLAGKFGAGRPGVEEAGRSLVAPLAFRGQALGVVVALDRIGEPGRFDDEDQRLLDSFAASAATGVATAKSMAEERLNNTIQAAEQERSRWARELHDETLQTLAVLRMRLSAALQEGSAEDLEGAGRQAVDQIDDEIVKLRSLITELRPAALDQIGLEAALEALAEHHTKSDGMHVQCRLDLPREEGERPIPVLETTVYRLVQEALNNAARHSHAENAELAVRSTSGTIEVSVSDDGVGFEPAMVREGFGLVGMRERISLVGGTFEVNSTRGAGTTVEARIPLASRAMADPQDGSVRTRSGRGRARSGPGPSA
jgi:two-component system, NarL family, sensor histidine kinase DevS